MVRQWHSNLMVSVSTRLICSCLVYSVSDMLFESRWVVKTRRAVSAEGGHQLCQLLLNAVSTTLLVMLLAGILMYVMSAGGSNKASGGIGRGTGATQAAGATGANAKVQVCHIISVPQSSARCSCNVADKQC